MSSQFRRIRSLLATAWSHVPGQSHGARVLWTWHFLALIGLILMLKDWKLPSEWPTDLLNGKPPKFSAVLQLGLWKGGIIHACVSALIVGSVQWWSRAKPCPIETQFPQPQPSRWWFWPVLLVIIVGATSLRLPRMAHSYWGDEGWALRYYGHGKYEAVSGDDMQGPIKFKPVTWSRVLWDDQTGGNHYLFSILQKLTMDTWRSWKGLPVTAFDEAVSRLPLLLGGLASIAAIALFLRWLGRPRAGLFAAAFFAIHPWHIRYSTEARGYILMVFFFTLAVWALLYALRSDRWRGWLWLAALQFLAVYSWKVAALPFLTITSIVSLALLLKRGEGAPTIGERMSRLARPLVVGLTAGALFVFMVAPCSLQSPRAIERLKNTGKPMESHWFYNSLTGLLIGVPWFRASLENPTEVPLKEALAARPLTVRFGLMAALGLLVAGAATLFHHRPLQGWMWLSVFAAGALGASVFKWVMGIEWIFWYFYFIILPLAVFTGLGLDALWSKADTIRLPGAAPLARLTGALCLVLGLLAPPAMAWVAWPQIKLMHWQPYESHRRAFELTRGQHEPWGFEGPSKIITCHLWRHIDLYDPRADTYVRDSKRLRERMAEADQNGGALYYVVGQRKLFRELQADVYAMLRDPQLFELKDILWAEEDIHTLEIFRYRGKATPQP